jgi:GTP pyrophosphokinase
MVETADGGLDVLAYDHNTGSFQRDMSYLARCSDPFADVDQLSERQFEEHVRRLNGTPMTLDRLSDAFSFALDLHRTQVRKGSNTPYIAHLMGVSSLALEFGADEDEAIAALLHDAAEDQGGARTLAEIERRFGHRVAEIVEHCTDALTEPKPPWRERKEAYLRLLATAPASVKLVSGSDKLYNARCLVSDYRAVGEALWDRFSGGRDGVLWYYGRLPEVLQGGPMLLVDELERTCNQLAKLAD